MSLITILLAITALVMVSIQTADDAPEEVRMDLDKFLQSEVQKMSKMDVVNAQHAKAMQQMVKETAKKPRPTAVKEEMVQQIQDDKPAKKAGPSLMTLASSEYLRHKKSKESDEWMDDDEDDDKELAMPSVTKEGDVAMFQEHTSRRSRSLDRLLNGNKRKLSEKKMDSFSASLLGDVAPPAPKQHKPHIHLSRLLNPHSAHKHIEHKHSEHKKLAEVKKEKKQAQHKKKELKKMNQFREHMKSFWAQAHANDPKTKKTAPKPAAKPKLHVICKPPTCLPRGHHYEHPHGAAAKKLKDEDPLSVLEQAYPNKKIKKVKKKVSIWDKADPLRVADPLKLESSGAAAAIGAAVASAHRRKAPRTLEDIIDQAPQDAFVQPVEKKKVAKMIKKVPKAPAKKPRAAAADAASLDLDQENPWETDHFAQKMSNTWHTRNAMANMQMALTNAEHSNSIDAARKMAPKLSRKERIAQKTRMLKRKLRVSLKQVKKKFNHAFVRRQKAKKAAAKAKKAKKKLKKKQAKEAVATHTATSAVETAFANVFDSAWRK